MTPEERLTSIENLLKALTESQVRLEAVQSQNAEQIAKHSEQIAKHSEQIEKHSELIAKNDEQIEKNTAGIRDLIVVSGTVLAAVQAQTKSIQELRESQAMTDEKLNILIDTVDRIIRRENGDHGTKR
jgi:hypothetical protein